MARKVKDHWIGIRLTKDHYASFKKKTQAQNESVSNIARLLIEAYIEDRLFVKPKVVSTIPQK